MNDRTRILPVIRGLRVPTPAVVGLIAVAAAAILAFDLSLPLGVAGGVPYVVLVLLGVWLPSRRYILVLAGVGSVLTVIGYVFSPAGGVPWIVLTNRGLALFVIWVVAILFLERKWVEEELTALTTSLARETQQSEERLHAVFDHTPVCLNLKDTEGRYLLVNKPYAEWLGRPAEEIVGKRACELMENVSEVDDLTAAESAVLVTGETYEQEISVPRPDGKVYHRIMIKYPVKSADGLITAIGTVAVDISERKRAEEGLRRLAAAIDRLSENFALFDANDELVMCNQGYHRVNEPIADLLVPGVTFEDHLRAMVDKGLIPEAAGREEEWLRERMQRHWNPGPPFEVRRRGGICFLVHEQRLADGSTAIISTDITELKQTEEGMRESRLNLLEAQRIAHIGNWSRDVESGRLLWSDEVYRIFGKEPEETAFTYQDFKELVHPDDVKRLEDSMEKTLSEGKARSLEYRIVRSDGTIRWVFVNAIPTVDDEGKPVRIGGTLQDITERKIAEQALRAKEENITAILSNTTEGIITISETGLIESFNPAAEDIFGYRADEIIGRNVNVLMPEPERSAHDGYIKNYRRTGVARILGVQARELTAARKDGAEFPIELNVSEFHLGDQRRFIGGVRDITRRKQAEEERKNIDRQLHQMERMDSLGQLAGGVAHEFNNMLVPVIGLTELAMDDLPEESQTRMNLQMALEGADRARRLVKQILSFGRIQERSVGAIVLDETVGEAIDMLRTTLLSTIKISMDLDASGVKALCDPSEFHQVIMNLGANAAAAMEDGKGKLSFSSDKTEILKVRVFGDDILMPGPYARLIVRDNGCGMDQETASRIFEPFFTTKEVGEGTGLGLSVVHGIIVAYGGAVRVESEPGKGTTFEIFIPIPSESELTGHIDGVSEDILQESG